MPPDNELHAQLIAERDKLREEIALLREKEAEQHRLQKELHLRHSEINALLNIKPHPVISRFDRNLRHTYVYATTELATGIPLKEYIGRTSREMGMPEPSISLLENAMELVFDKGAEKVIEYTMTSENRKWIFETRLIPEFNHTHAVEQVLVITRDITRQKRAEVFRHLRHRHGIDEFADESAHVIGSLFFRRVTEQPACRVHAFVSLVVGGCLWPHVAELEPDPLESHFAHGVLTEFRVDLLQALASGITRLVKAVPELPLQQKVLSLLVAQDRLSKHLVFRFEALQEIF